MNLFADLHHDIIVSYANLLAKENNLRIELNIVNDQLSVLLVSMTSEDLNEAYRLFKFGEMKGGNYEEKNEKKS